VVERRSDHTVRVRSRSFPVLPLVAVAVLVVSACTSSGGSSVTAPDGTEVDLTHVGNVSAPDFPAGLEWLNVDEPLSLRDLRGKVVLLDFWTQGCINCIHIIPDLKRLEAQHPDTLVVVGVHSAKFDREGQIDAVRQSVVRYELEHPVVNDRDFTVWNAYNAQAWPTTVLIDPNGKIVGGHSGEGIYEIYGSVIATMVEEYGAAGLLDDRPLDVVLEAERAAPSVLAFPGSILADETTGRLFIADSNNHRILVTDLDGAILEVIGGPHGAGGDDDSYVDASFNRPQGMALDSAGRTLYVADLGNHLIRAVDLEARLVVTVAGTGEQGFEDPREPQPAVTTPLNSPWDVLVDGEQVHIAMSGQHQLWTLDLADSTVQTLAGSRREELRDGAALEAGFNQPSGLTSDGSVLYISDPEASAIRTLTLGGEPGSGEVGTLVGTGLFDFGDRDGRGDGVLLQHAISVVAVDGVVFFTDTYNHKIKVLDPRDRSVTTLAGIGAPGWSDGDGRTARFAEPSGISEANGILYVADTNNHLIRTIDIVTGTADTLTLQNLELARAAMSTDLRADRVRLDPVEVAPGNVTLSLVIEVPDGYKFNEQGAFTMEWTSASPAVAAFVGETTYRQVLPTFPREFAIDATGGETVLSAAATVYYCQAGEEDFCLIRDLEIEVPLTVASGQESGAASDVIEVRHVLPALDLPADPIV